MECVKCRVWWSVECGVGSVECAFSMVFNGIYIYMVFCIFNGIFYSMKNEYQQNQQFHINIFIKEGTITGISLVCWNILSVGFMYIYICRFSAPSMDY